MNRKAKDADVRRFAIIDRDGTLIREVNYLSRPEQVELLPGAVEGLCRFQRLGIGLVVVTNQSGIGRGYFGWDDLRRIHEVLYSLLDRHGIGVDGVYVCPHAPQERCSCRKPGTALVERAAADLDFDPCDGFVIGDKGTDIELGRAIGATSILVRTGHGGLVDTRLLRQAPDHVERDLNHASMRVAGIVGLNGPS